MPARLQKTVQALLSFENAAKVKCTFPHELERSKFAGPRTQPDLVPREVSPEATKLSSELIQFYITGTLIRKTSTPRYKSSRLLISSRPFRAEAIQRCMKLAEEEGTNRLDKRHLEQILAQLMLDF